MGGGAIGPVGPTGGITGPVIGGYSPVHSTGSSIHSGGPVSTVDFAGRSPSSGVLPRPPSRSRTNIVTAANDLSALERKIQNLESRVNSFDSLPEMLERKGSDTNATPVKDMWNFTNLTSRVLSAEQSIGKVN